ncbi:MAG TPA: methyltransferase [Malonomonas sp.]
MTDHWDPAKLLETSGSYWQGSALQAAVRLDIFSHLSAASVPAEGLAALLDCDRRSLQMLLRALAAMGLLEKDRSGYRCAEPVRSWLDANSSQYLGHIIRHHQHLVESWSRLDQAVRSGQPQRQRSSYAEDEWRNDFLLGMHNLSSLLAPQLVPRIPLQNPQRLLDVGGGPGTWSLHFCRQHPQLQATVFDLPASEPIFRANVANSPLSERLQFVGGDFLQLPLGAGFDVAWLSHVLHGEGPENAAALVRQAADALAAGGTLLIHEFILNDEDEGPLYPALFSLNMLLGTEQGQSYSEAELVQMCQAAGLVDCVRIGLPEQLKSGVISARKP